MRVNIQISFESTTDLILFQIVLETQMNAIELHTNIICYQKVSMSFFLCDLFIFCYIITFNSSMLPYH